MKYRKGVFAIILDQDDKFLLVQKVDYKKGWTLVGGGGEEGETLEENLFREIEEELGVDKTKFDLIGIAENKLKYDYPKEVAKKVHGGKYKGQEYTQCVLRFVGQKSDLIFSEVEFKDNKWVDGERLKENLIFPNQYENHSKAIREFFPNLP